VAGEQKGDEKRIAVAGQSCHAGLYRAEKIPYGRCIVPSILIIVLSHSFYPFSFYIR
jgi:hypothetical protein